ncbi:MAG: cyclase family protein, partial [Pirellulales bacterium]|nr:cyclase family protein [Pirellulales bacterium]
MRIIDLSLPIDARMSGVKIETARRLETDGWNATTLQLYSHCGTHMDAPRHFLSDGATLDQQALGVCVGPALVVNMAPAQPRQLITISDLEPHADSIQPGCRLLFRTDWHQRYQTLQYRDELPRISIELARWLVEKKVG